MSNPRPWSPAELAVMREMVDLLLSLDETTGGWTGKIDARPTGFSLYIKFDRRSPVDDVLRAARVYLL